MPSAYPIIVSARPIEFLLLCSQGHLISILDMAAAILVRSWTNGPSLQGRYLGFAHYDAAYRCCRGRCHSTSEGFVARRTLEP